jgi:hypothetical protein
VSNFLAVAPIQQCCQTATSSPSSSSLLKPTTVLLKPMRRRRLPVREPQAGDWLCSCGLLLFRLVKVDQNFPVKILMIGHVLAVK